MPSDAKKDVYLILPPLINEINANLPVGPSFGLEFVVYKGLGTWDSESGKQHFRELSKHKITFKYDNRNSNETVRTVIEKAFSKKNNKTNDRKFG